MMAILATSRWLPHAERNVIVFAEEKSTFIHKLLKLWLRDCCGELYRRFATAPSRQLGKIARGIPWTVYLFHARQKDCFDSTGSRQP